MFESMRFGIQPVVTRVSDPLYGKAHMESGVHAQKRAVDFRDQYAGKRLYTDEQVEAITEAINSAFPRRDTFKTCVHHAIEGGNLHFHLQTAPNWAVYRLEETSVANWRRLQ